MNCAILESPRSWTRSINYPQRNKCHRRYFLKCLQNNKIKVWNSSQPKTRHFSCFFLPYNTIHLAENGRQKKICMAYVCGFRKMYRHVLVTVNTDLNGWTSDAKRLKIDPKCLETQAGQCRHRRKQKQWKILELQTNLHEKKPTTWQHELRLNRSICCLISFNSLITIRRLAFRLQS